MCIACRGDDVGKAIERTRRHKALVDNTDGQRSLYRIRALDEEAAGLAPSGSAVQLRCSNDPWGTFGERVHGSLLLLH